MTGSQLYLNLSLTYLILPNPYLIRQSLMWTVSIDTNSPVPTAPRRRQVQIHSTIISELEKPTRYKQVLYVPCYQVAETDKS